MRTYWLVADKEYNGTLKVHVSDVPSRAGRSVLMKLDAKSYDEAVKMVSFSVWTAGRSVWCGVDVNGRPYHGGSDED